MNANVTSRIAPALGLLLLGGCGTTQFHGQPPEYLTAYHAGCWSGYAQALSDNSLTHVATKDPDLYAGNDAYRRGWDFGFDECYEETNSFGGGGSVL